MVTALHNAERGPEAALSIVVVIGLLLTAPSLSWAKASVRPLLRRRRQMRRYVAAGEFPGVFTHTIDSRVPDLNR